MSNKIEDKARKILENAEYEFWRSGAAKVIVMAQKTLVAAGVDADLANDVIRGIWETAAAEYGN